MRIYDVQLKKFITIADSKVVSTGTLGNMTVGFSTLIPKAYGLFEEGETANMTSGTFAILNSVDMEHPKLGTLKKQSLGLVKIPYNYYAADSNFEAYFREVYLIAKSDIQYTAEVGFDVTNISAGSVDKSFGLHSVEIIGDSFQYVIYEV